MRRAIGSFFVLALLGGAVWGGLASDGDGADTFQLIEVDGDSIGTLRLLPGTELCWDLTLQSLPKAVQLHYDAPGSLDPVEVSFFEPPAVRPNGCGRLNSESADILRTDPASFYVDGHIADDELQPVLRATIVPR